MSEQTELKFSELEKLTSGGVYILNNTAGHERGKVVFTVPHANGQGHDTVIVPATFIPVDLLEQVSRRQLMESSEFRRCISTRRLKIITQKYAEELLEDEDAQEEKERLYNEAESHNNMVQAMDDIQTGDMLEPELAGIGSRRGADGEIRENASTKGDNGLNKGNSNGLESFEVHPKVESIMETLSETKDETGALNSLRNMGELTSKDYKYIVKKADASYIKLRDWASLKLKPKK